MFSLVSYQKFKSIKTHPEIITKLDEKMINDLDYEGIKFPVSKKDFSNIEKKRIFAIMYFLKKMI